MKELLKNFYNIIVDEYYEVLEGYILYEGDNIYYLYTKHSSNIKLHSSYSYNSITTIVISSIPSSCSSHLVTAYLYNSSAACL